MSNVGAQLVPKTEERILANALRHFCDFGYNGTSVREITAASEVTKPTLYYYFKNKEELFTKLAESCFALVLKSVDDVVQNEASFEKTITSLFNALNEVFTQNPSAVKFIHSIAVSPQRGTPDVGIKDFVAKLDSQVRAVVIKATKNGECLEEKADIIIILLSALLGLFTKSLITSTSHSLKDQEATAKIIASVVACSRNGACPPASV